MHHSWLTNGTRSSRLEQAAHTLAHSGGQLLSRSMAKIGQGQVACWHEELLERICNVKKKCCVPRVSLLETMGQEAGSEIPTLSLTCQ